MLKEYIYNGVQYQFTEGDQPEGAVELKAQPPEKVAQTKVVKPANKAKAVKAK